LSSAGSTENIEEEYTRKQLYRDINVSQPTKISKMPNAWLTCGVTWRFFCALCKKNAVLRSQV